MRHIKLIASVTAAIMAFTCLPLTVMAESVENTLLRSRPQEVTEAEESGELIEMEVPVAQDKIHWGDTEGNGNVRITLYNIYNDISTTGGEYDPDISAVDPSYFKHVRKAEVSFTIDGIDEALGSDAEFAARIAYSGSNWLATDFDTTIQINGDGRYSISTNFEPLIDEETGMPVPAEDSGLTVFSIDILDLVEQLGMDSETYDSVVDISDVSIVVTMPVLPEFECTEDGTLTAYNGFDKDVVIPDEVDGITVRTVSYNAFYFCNYVETITLPATLEWLSETTFLHCPLLKAIYVSDDSIYYSSKDGVLFRDEAGVGLTLSVVPRSYPHDNYDVPEGVVVIGYNSFENNKYIKTVTIPDSVTQIESNAFYECESLERVNIPDSVTEIGSYAFYQSDNKVTIYGDRGSYAQEYAKENGITFIDPDSTLSDELTGVTAYLLDWSMPEGAVLNVDYTEGENYAQIYNIYITVDGKEIPFGGKTELLIPSDFGKNMRAIIQDENGNDVAGAETLAGSISFTVDRSGKYTISPEKSIPEGSLFAGLVFQTNTIAFRNNINQSTAYILQEDDTFKEYERWSVNDAQIKENGTYTVSFDRDLASESGDITESAWNVLKLQTNISPFDHPDFNITIDSLKIDGREIEMEENVPLYVENIFVDDYSDVYGYIPKGTDQMEAYSLVFCNIWSYDEIISADDYGEKVEVTFTVSGMESSINDGKFRYEETEDGNVRITQYVGSETDVVIPSEINGKKVTAIGEYAFNSNETMTNVTIPDSIVEIGECAFNSCTSLESVYIPASVETLGKTVFMECYSLTAIEVDENNKYYKDIDGVLFNKDETTLLQFPISKGGDYIVPDGVVTIAESAFEKNYYVTSVTMPDSVREMGPRAFFACVALKTVNFSKNITEISNAAFMFCPYLESAAIPEGVTTIGDSAFGYCYALKSADIPESVTIIKDHAYTVCDSLTEITIPDNVKEIGMNAFSHCTNLTSVTLSNNMTKLNDYTFYDCMKLEKAVIPANVVDFGEYIFGKEIYDDDNNIIGYEYPEKLTLYGYADSPAQAYAKKNSFKFIVIGSTVTDEKSDIAVSGSDNTVPEDAVLIVEQTLSDDSTISYDITLTSGGEEIQPEGEVSVRIPVPEGWSGKEIHVYHKDANGRLTDMNAVVSGDYIIFTTDHFSEYVITTEKQDTVMLGDVNGDGEVGELDSVELARYLANWNVTIDEDAADLDGDGEVGETDSVILARRLAGWNV